MPRPKVPAWRKAVHRRLRQARHRRKPEVREKRRAADKARYWANPEKKRAQVRRWLREGPADDSSLDQDYRIAGGPGSWELQCDPNLRGEFKTVFHDIEIRAFLAFGKDNPRMRMFVRRELMRRYPTKYPTQRSLPRCLDVRNGPRWDVRERARLIRQTEGARYTEPVACPSEWCGHFGVMAKWDGVHPDPGPGRFAAYCPACRGGMYLPEEFLAGPSVERACPACSEENPLRRTGETVEATCGQCGTELGQWTGDGRFVSNF